MKRTLLSLITLLTVLLLHAQADVKDQVTAAIGAGDVNALGEKLVPNVDLTVLTTSDYYSKAQATGILRKFFEYGNTGGTAPQTTRNTDKMSQ